jgi:hypothetical protein
MRNIKWLLTAGLIAVTTAGCVETTGYPTTAYNNGYPAVANNGYPAVTYSNGYPTAAYNNANPAYNNGTPVYRNGNPAYYNGNPAYNYGTAYNNPHNNPNGDYRYYRDANGNVVAVPHQR